MYYLSNGGRTQKTANAFGVASCTVSYIVKRVTEAISSHMKQFVKVPDSEIAVKEVVAKFYEKHGFPQCISAVDGTHIPITHPKENLMDYINREGFFSLHVHVSLDYMYCFFDVNIKWSGSVHGARVFANSSITELLRNGTIPRYPKVIVDGEKAVPISLLGDPAYQLLPNLLNEFAKGGSTEKEQFFGYRLSSARAVVECAFGRLNARFGILRRAIDIGLQNLPNIILACFVLHNFCELAGDHINEELSRAAIDNDNILQPSSQAINQDVHNNERGGKHYLRILMTFFE